VSFLGPRADTNTKGRGLKGRGTSTGEEVGGGDNSTKKGLTGAGDGELSM